MILRAYVKFNKLVQEFDTDLLQHDLNTCLNALDCIYSHTVVEDLEYAGGFDDPAGLVKGTIIVVCEVCSYDMQTAKSTIRDTAEAYDADEVEFDY